MAAIKIHMRRGDDSANGFESCDFRGDKAVHPPVDHHSTIPQFEVDPATDEQIARCLAIGPELNRFLAEVFGKKLDDAVPDEVEALTGGGPYPRIGVWDD